MAHYNGIDMIEISRVRRAIARWGEPFLKKVYTQAEIERYREKPSSLAARFACKEAVMKLLGTGRKGVGWREIETLSHSSGKPLVRLYGRAQDRANELGLQEITVSLSHSKTYAIASVIGTTEKESF